MDKFLEVGTRIGNQKHMIAIRDGFALTLPLIMAGALALMLNNVFFNNGSLLATYMNKGDNPFHNFTNAWISPWLGAFDNGTLAITGLALVATLAYTRAMQEKADAISTVIVSIGAFFILNPNVRKSEVAFWITHYFGPMGVFVALFTGLIASEVFIRIMKKGWIIKMPEMVPPAVGKGFAAIIPGALALAGFALVTAIFGMLHNQKILGEGDPTNIFMAFESVLQNTLMKWFGGTDPEQFLSGLIGVFFVTLFQTIFWFFGIHGANMLQPVIAPIWGVFDTLNAQAYAQSLASHTEAVLYPWTSGSWVIYVNHGGSGATLGLLIAIKIFSRKKDEHEIVKIAAPSSVFQINEPIIFGIPIVLNPIFAIPFVLCTPILAAFAYTSVHLGFGMPPVNPIPWTTPPILSAFLATNGNIPSVILSILTIGLSTVIYAPFVMLSTRREKKDSI